MDLMAPQLSDAARGRTTKEETGELKELCFDLEHAMLDIRLICAALHGPPSASSVMNHLLQASK